MQVWPTRSLENSKNDVSGFFRSRIWRTFYLSCRASNFRKSKTKWNNRAEFWNWQHKLESASPRTSRLEQEWVLLSRLPKGFCKTTVSFTVALVELSTCLRLPKVEMTIRLDFFRCLQIWRNTNRPKRTQATSPRARCMGVQSTTLYIQHCSVAYCVLHCTYHFVQ